MEDQQEGRPLGEGLGAGSWEFGRLKAALEQQGPDWATVYLTSQVWPPPSSIVYLVIIQVEKGPEKLCPRATSRRPGHSTLPLPPQAQRQPRVLGLNQASKTLLQQDKSNDTEDVGNIFISKSTY